MQFDITRLVDPVDIAEARSDGEVRADLGQSRPDVMNVFWLSVEGVVVDTFVVYPVFLSTSNADFLELVRPIPDDQIHCIPFRAIVS